MKYFITRLNKITILFLIFLLFSPAKVYSKEHKTRSYKGKVDVYENIERVNWQWWARFEDSILLNCLQESVKNNFDVLIADFKTEEAKNYMDSSNRNVFPAIKTGSYYKNAKNAQFGLYGNRWSYYANKSQNIIYLPVEFSYEIDLWRKNRDERDYFLQNSYLAEFEKNFIIQATVSEVSSLYFNILKNEKIIGLHEEIMDLKRKKYDINLEKYEKRLVAKPKLLAVEKELNLTEKELTDLKAQNEELKNQFYLFVFGDKEKSPVIFQNIDEIKVFYDTKLEIHTERIANRPDVLMAEKGIKMAELDVKMARKSFLPKLSFEGDVSHITRMFNDFLNSENIMYRVGLGLADNFFEKGKNMAELEAKKNIYQQALKKYEKAIISSINDINNSLCFLESGIKNYNTAKKNSDLDKENLDIEKEKLDLNLIAYEEYISSQERFIRTKIAEYESKTECLIHTISLYKAFGGNV
ncbi:MAG TPA: TolC family protein [Candidatus Gastranaerophilales bacterium]|nr:TolC family protein [Candidatus Gastranaerophilales bacterium]